MLSVSGVSDCDSELFPVDREAPAFDIPVAYTPADIPAAIPADSSGILRDWRCVGVDGCK